MKKTFTIFAIALFLFNALQAQMKKNDLLLGGSLGISQSNTETDGAAKVKTTTFSVSPSIGTFYRDNRMAGFSLTYTHFTTEGNYKNNAFGAGFFLRQYKSLGKSWYIFLNEGLGGQVGAEKRSFNGGRQKSQVSQVFLTAFPGIAYTAGRHLQLEVTLTNLVALGYSSQKVTYTDNPNQPNYKTHQYYLNTGFNSDNLTNLSFGMKWLLTAKK